MNKREIIMETKDVEVKVSKRNQKMIAKETKTWRDL